MLGILSMKCYVCVCVCANGRWFVLYKLTIGYNSITITLCFHKPHYIFNIRSDIWRALFESQYIVFALGSNVRDRKKKNVPQRRNRESGREERVVVWGRWGTELLNWYFIAFKACSFFYWWYMFNTNGIEFYRFYLHLHI